MVLPSSKLSFSLRVLGVSCASLFTELIVRVLLLGILFALPRRVPAYMDIAPELAYKYSYPYSPSASIPIHLLTLGVVVTTVVVLVVTQLTYRKHMQWTVDAFHYILGLSMTLLTTYITVQALKVWVARPRPDFIARCYPEGIDMQMWSRVPQCTRALSDVVINDGLQSFPSGHSACAWAAGCFCFLYIWEKVKCFGTSRLGTLCVPRCLPFCFGFIFALFSTYVGCTRIWDYQHHVEDVVVGALIAIFSAVFSFSLYYPLHHQLLCGYPASFGFPSHSARNALDAAALKPLRDDMIEYQEV